MTSTSLSRSAERFILASALVATLATAAHAQEAAAPAAQEKTASSDDHVELLDSMVVSATRTPQDLKYTASSVSVVPLATLANSQVTDLHTALAQTPGIVVTTTGAAGSRSTVSLRGSSSAQTLFVVDGVRMSTRQNDFYMSSVFGGADLAGIDRVEVLRGPQSTLYGSSAMGGVISLTTAHGCGEPTGSIVVGGGSFGSWGSTVTESGGTQNLGYSASVGYSETDNERDYNHYERWTYSTRVEYTPTPTTLVGVTFRGQNADLQEPNALQYASNPGDLESDNYLGTVYGQVRVGESFKSRLTAGWHQNAYDWADSWGADDYQTTRRILDWQNTWEAASWATVVAGANAEWSHFDSTTVTGQLSDRANGYYLSTDAHPVKNLTLTAGLRYDDFNTSGSATTWRAGVAYWIEATQTKLRATYGTGFNAPSMTERYGSSWYNPNPDLRAEKSRGWDIGFDQHLWDGRVTLSSTYFHNRFRDMIDAQPVSGSWMYVYGNINRATSQGVENAVLLQLTKAVSFRAAYTYLDVRNDTADTRVAYKPRHTADADLQWAIDSKWTVGTGLHIVADRLRSATLEMEDYTTARVYASYAVNDQLRIKARVENVLDEKYEESFGYPALPIGVFGAVEWRF